MDTVYPPVYAILCGIMMPPKFIEPNTPALVLAPMQGLTDAPMRAFCTESGTFTFAVSEFLRVSQTVPPQRQFRRHVPELSTEGRTESGTPVQVQILGGHPGRMAQAAAVACAAGAQAVDINFGCPAPTVNRHDGGAALLRDPLRLREIVREVRDAVPPHVPVSAKLRLGWDNVDDIDRNADMAEQGGASWLTVHGRTRAEGYRPPAHWEPIGRVRARLSIPVVANGDVWSVTDLCRCRDVTGCIHFMLGRGALADPLFPAQAAHALGLRSCPAVTETDWPTRLRRLMQITNAQGGNAAHRQMTARLKQWLYLAHLHGGFSLFDRIKRAASPDELLGLLEDGQNPPPSPPISGGV